MNRTLKRPMFRRGGSAGGGITSGLERPNYNTGSVGAVGSEVQRISDLYNKFAPNVQTQSMPGSVSSFLTNFGLNLMSASPRGGLLSTAATAAKEPFNTFQTMQAQRSLQDRALQQAIVGQAIETDTAKRAAEAEQAFEASQSELDRASDLEIAQIKSKEGYAAQTREAQFEVLTDLYKDNPNQIIQDNAANIADFRLRAKDSDKPVYTLNYEYNNKSKKFEPNFQSVPPGFVFLDASTGKAYKRDGGNFTEIDAITLQPIQDVDGTE